MSRMSPGEGLCGFTHILTLALLACAKVNYVGTLAVHLLSNFVNFLGVCASEGASFYQNFTGMALFSTF